jgi:hypothetical protein
LGTKSGDFAQRLLSSNLRNLLKGRADLGTSMKVGVMTSSLQQFLDGKANISMASKLGLMTSDLQFLLDSVGKKGAIGIVLGLIIKN